MRLNPFIGEISIFAGDFPPRGWAFCNGQLLSISQNTALFSILGTIYGGDGRTTFALPDLRGRAPMQPRIGPGLSPRQLGERSGAEEVTLTIAQMPSHNHILNNNNDLSAPDGTKYLNAPFDDTTGDVPPTSHHLGDQTFSYEGGGQSHNNMQPYLAINYVIALVGTYPSRS